MNEIKTVIIPISGLGTRMYPITKVIEKVMLPIGTIPVIDFLIEEALNANISKFYIILNKDQLNIKRYLLNKNLDITYIYQENLNGLGGALLLCKDYIKEDFCVMLSDELIFNHNALKQLIENYQKFKTHIIGIKSVYNKEKRNYGMVKIKKNKIIEGREKPSKYNSSSAIIGRYVFKNSIFDLLLKCKEEEVGLSNVIFDNLNNNFIGVKIKGKRFDVGNKKGYFKAIKYNNKRTSFK